MGIAHVCVSMVQFGKISSNMSGTWNSIRKGAAKMFGEDRRPLMSLEPIDMVLGSLMVVDGETIEEHDKLDDETRSLSEDLVEAILSRDDEIMEKSVSEASVFLANLSRYMTVIE